MGEKNGDVGHVATYLERKLSDVRDLSTQANFCSEPASQRVSVPMDYVGFLGASHLIQAVMFTEWYF